MGEFSSDDHYIYYCVQESLRRYRVGLTVNKRVQIAVLGCNLKNDRVISVHFQVKPFNITVIQVYALTSNAEKLKLNRSMNQSKLNTVKQEMAIDILGISELKWTGEWVNLAQMTIISTTVGKNPLEEME